MTLGFVKPEAWQRSYLMAVGKNNGVLTKKVPETAKIFMVVVSRAFHGSGGGSMSFLGYKLLIEVLSIADIVIAWPVIKFQDLEIWSSNIMGLTISKTLTCSLSVF